MNLPREGVSGFHIFQDHCCIIFRLYLLEIEGFLGKGLLINVNQDGSISEQANHAFCGQDLGVDRFHNTWPKCS